MCCVSVMLDIQTEGKRESVCVRERESLCVFCVRVEIVALFFHFHMKTRGLKCAIGDGISFFLVKLFFFFPLLSFRGRLCRKL